MTKDDLRNLFAQCRPEKLSRYPYSLYRTEAFSEYWNLLYDLYFKGRDYEASRLE